MATKFYQVFEELRHKDLVGTRADLRQGYEEGA